MVLFNNYIYLILKIKDLKLAKKDLTSQVEENGAQLCVFDKRIGNE